MPVSKLSCLHKLNNFVSVLNGKTEIPTASTSQGFIGMVLIKHLTTKPSTQLSVKLMPPVIITLIMFLFLFINRGFL